MRGLRDRGVVVSGGSRGIGLAAARRFVEEGARVFLAGLDPTEVAKAVDELRGGGTVAGAAYDVSKEEHVDRLVADATAFLGGIDVLVNNAGIASMEPFLEIGGSAVGRDHRREPPRAVPRRATRRPLHGRSRAGWRDREHGVDERARG